MTGDTQVLAGGFGFVESPRWRDGRLWFVDFLSQAVLTFDPATCETTVRATVPGVPGGIGFLPDGRPLVVSQQDFRILVIGPDGELSPHADISAFARGAANDMLVDPHGRAYVGHHGYAAFDDATPELASLILVQSDGTVREVADQMVFPNGMALTADGAILVVAETFANRLTAFDVRLDGALANRRIWADLGGRSPDGICMDGDGAIWAACPFTSEIVRVREGGEILRLATTPGKWPVACAVGGADGRQLFCTTAVTSMEDVRRGVSAGFIEAMAAS